MPDGSPQTTPVWVDRENGTVLINTEKGRVKCDNLRRDPRIALSILDPENPYASLQLRGKAELVEDGATEHIHRLARKYLGRDYPYLTPDTERVTVRILPDNVNFAVQG